MRELLLEQKKQADASVNAYQGIAKEVASLIDAQKQISSTINLVKSYDSAICEQLSLTEKAIADKITLIESNNAGLKLAYIKALKCLNAIDSDLRFDSLRVIESIKNAYTMLRERLMSAHGSWNVVDADDLPRFCDKLPLVPKEFEKNQFQSFRILKDNDDDVIKIIQTAVSYDGDMMVAYLDLNRELLFQYSIKNLDTVSVGIFNFKVRGKEKGATKMVDTTYPNAQTFIDSFIENISK